ncbi:MATE family efflux transporter [Bosea sp. Leaf344]|uniref:MATE family efflux transporter n=1 Tax=Bosea sp. Leaf344 TaxID=1736346 RepID=UPI000A4D7B82|nr:MATE family efflux transporter [Bosea sp. Leaf344]
MTRAPTDAAIAPSLLRLAAPMLVSRAGLAAMVLVDAVMLARFGARELAVATLAEGSFGRLSEVFGAFILSALVLVAAARPPAERARRLAIWRRAMACAAAMAGLGLAAAWLAPALLLAGGQEAGLVAAAAPVMLVAALGLPAGLVALACAVHLEGIGRPGLVAVSMLLANLVNLALNALLIAGGWGVPALGALGSALATALVRLALAIALVLTLLRIERPDGAGAEPIPHRDRARQIGLGLSAAGAAGTLHLLGLWLTIFAGWLGPVPLAAYASCWILSLPALLLAAGIGDAAAIRVAAASAEARPARLRRDLVTLALMLSPVTLLWLLAPGEVARAYAPDPGLAGAMAALLPVIGLVLMLDGLSLAASAGLRALHDIAVPTAIQIASMAATPPLAAMLAFSQGLGAGGLVGAILLTSAARLALLLMRIAARHAGTLRPRALLPSTDLP